MFPKRIKNRKTKIQKEKQKENNKIMDIAKNHEKKTKFTKQNNQKK